MLALFHIAEEVTRSLFGVQTRQNLDSGKEEKDRDHFSHHFTKEDLTDRSIVRLADTSGYRTSHSADQVDKGPLILSLAKVPILPKKGAHISRYGGIPVYRNSHFSVKH